MRLMMMAVFALVLAGCGTTASTRLDVVAKKGAFEFRDERPGNHRVGGKTVQTGGETTTIGDDGIQPEPVALFHTWLTKLPVERFDGKAVVLQEFEIQIYEPNVTGNPNRSFSTAGVPQASPGVAMLGILIGKGMLYGLDSARNQKSVHTRIAGTIGDQAFAANAYGSFKGRVSESDINSVVLKALDNLVLEVEKLGKV